MTLFTAADDYVPKFDSAPTDKWAGEDEEDEVKVRNRPIIPRSDARANIFHSIRLLLIVKLQLLTCKCNVFTCK